ncbi:hypothetical protein FQR65_LT20031 [Abscondita terminalis]|nr:hypothetical protein FQR65_LT20031 [Abscondita terminalis]
MADTVNAALQMWPRPAWSGRRSSPAADFEADRQDPPGGRLSAAEAPNVTVQTPMRRQLLQTRPRILGLPPRGSEVPRTVDRRLDTKPASARRSKVRSKSARVLRLGRRLQCSRVVMPRSVRRADFNKIAVREAIGHVLHETPMAVVNAVPPPIRSRLRTAPPWSPVLTRVPTSLAQSGLIQKALLPDRDSRPPRPPPTTNFANVRVSLVSCRGPANSTNLAAQETSGGTASRKSTWSWTSRCWQTCRARKELAINVGQRVTPTTTVFAIPPTAGQLPLAPRSKTCCPWYPGPGLPCAVGRDSMLVNRPDVATTPNPSNTVKRWPPHRTRRVYQRLRRCDQRFATTPMSTMRTQCRLQARPAGRHTLAYVDRPARRSSRSKPGPDPKPGQPFAGPGLRPQFVPHWHLAGLVEDPIDNVVTAFNASGINSADCYVYNHPVAVRVTSTVTRTAGQHADRDPAQRGYWRSKLHFEVNYTLRKTSYGQFGIMWRPTYYSNSRSRATSTTTPRRSRRSACRRGNGAYFRSRSVASLNGKRATSVRLEPRAITRGRQGRVLTSHT